MTNEPRSGEELSGTIHGIGLDRQHPQSNQETLLRLLRVRLDKLQDEKPEREERMNGRNDSQHLD